MFEGKPPLPPQANGQVPDDGAGNELGTITWPDLVARLSAARDLREEMGAELAHPAASFDAFSARHLASQVRFGPEKSKRGVNPDDLANGKGAGCRDGGRIRSDDTANRGNT